MGVITQRLRNCLKVALGNPGAEAEIESVLNTVLTPVADIDPITGGKTPVVPVVVTYTASPPPAATDAMTIAAGATPTNVELLNFCVNLQANVASLQAVLHASGITT